MSAITTKAMREFSPKVSVITGYYNRADVVEMTIRSILSQTYEDFELIAFDDCSTDGTGERLLALQHRLKDQRFKVVVHRTNKGFTQGMIDAVGSSSGEYICVQGSGDISLPQRIERQVALLEARPEVGAVGCWYTNVVSTTGARRKRKPRADEVGFTELLKGNVFSHGEVMIRRSAYEAAGGYRAEFKNCQDYDLWLRISRIAKLATVPEFLYERYIRFDGVSYHPQKFSLQARYSLLAKRLAQMSDAQAAHELGRLGTSGPLALVEQSDPELQSKYMKACLRSAVFGAPREAKALATENITNDLFRRGLLSLIALFESRPLTPLRKIVPRILGITANGGL